MGVKQLFNLHGKTALVTGASQGIGRSVALALAEQGANVVVNYRSNRALAELVQAAIQARGVQAWLWEYDLGSDTITADFYRLCEEWGFQIDILVLNASIQIRKP